MEYIYDTFLQYLAWLIVAAVAIGLAVRLGRPLTRRKKTITRNLIKRH